MDMKHTYSKENKYAKQEKHEYSSENKSMDSKHKYQKPEMREYSIKSKVMDEQRSHSKSNEYNAPKKNEHSESKSMDEKKAYKGKEQWERKDVVERYMPKHSPMKDNHSHESNEHHGKSLNYSHHSKEYRKEMSPWGKGKENLSEHPTDKIYKYHHGNRHGKKVIDEMDDQTHSPKFFGSYSQPEIYYRERKYGDHSDEYAISKSDESINENSHVSKEMSSPRKPHKYIHLNKPTRKRVYPNNRMQIPLKTKTEFIRSKSLNGMKTENKKGFTRWFSVDIDDTKSDESKEYPLKRFNKRAIDEPKIIIKEEYAQENENYSAKDRHEECAQPMCEEKYENAATGNKYEHNEYQEDHECKVKVGDGQKISCDY